jgi:hypothetical protein
MHASRIRLLVTFGLAVVLSLIAASGAAAQAVPENLSYGAQNANIELAHRLVEEVFNGGDEAVAAVLVDDDAKIVTPFATYTGPDGLLEYLALIKEPYNTATFDITGVRVSGDEVDITWRLKGTRTVLDPTEAPHAADVEFTGVTSLILDSGEIASASHTYSSVAVDAPGGEIAATGGGCAFGPCIP